MIAGYVLTGGKNTRMNGKKKLYLTYNGEFFYEAVLRAFQDFPKIYLSVEAEEPYMDLDIPMIPDLYPAIGPLGGIYSGLVQCPEEALCVAACDMPLIDREAVRALCRCYLEHPGKITVAKAGGRIQPLFAIYPKSVLPRMEQMIAKKNYKMMDLFSTVDVFVAKFVQEEVTANINTPEEYEKLQYIVRQEYGTKSESF